MNENSPLYLGLDFSTQSLTAILIDQSGKKQQEININYAETFPHYNTDNGVIYSNTSFRKKKCEEEQQQEEENDDEEATGNDREAVAPVAMFLDALDKLFDSSASSSNNNNNNNSVISSELAKRIIAVSVSAQQHATVYCGEKFDRVLKNLNINESLATQIVPTLTREFSPLWLDASTGKYIEKMRENLKKLLLLSHNHKNKINDDNNDGEKGDADDDIDIEMKVTAYVKVVSGSDFTMRFPAAQISKFADKNPEKFGQTKTIHLLSSFITSIIANKNVRQVEHGDAAGANLMRIPSSSSVSQGKTKTSEENNNNNSPPRGFDYDELLLASTGIDPKVLREKLPCIIPSATIVSRSTEKKQYFEDKYHIGQQQQRQERQSSSSSFSVIAGTGDNPSSLVGVGLISGGRCCVSLGTSDTMFAPILNENCHESHNNNNATSCCPKLKNIGHIFGNPANDRGFLKLICFSNGSRAREKMRLQSGISSWQEASEKLLTLLETNKSFLSSVKPVLPFYFNEHSPVLPANQQLQKIRKEEHDDEHQHLFEVFCYSQVCHLRVSAQEANIPCTQILLTGGASINNGLCQIFADVFNVSVVQRPDTSSSAALGAALRALQQQEQLSWIQIEEFVSKQNATNEKIFEPRKEFVKETNKFFEEYQKMLFAVLN